MLNDFRHALRQVVNRPGFSLVVVLMLALGVGANAAMFSLFHQVLLRPLPVPAPEQLVLLSDDGPKSGSVSCSGMGGCQYVFSYPMLRDLEREQTVFTGVAAHGQFGANLAIDGRAVAAAGALVNGSYFSVLQLAPALGRLIVPADEPAPGEGSVVVLSHDYWQNAFGGDPGVLGRMLTVNGHALEIVGVAPAGFHGASFGLRPQVFVPLSLRPKMQPFFTAPIDSRTSYWIYMFARLKPGVTMDEAANGINALYNGIINEIEAPLNSFSEQTMERFQQKRLTLEPGARGQSSTPEQARLPLMLLLGVTMLVLLIACVNIANLLLARGATRAGEMAVRTAIGASRWRMVRQLLVEAILLGVLGLAASLPVAIGTLTVIAALMPAQIALNLPIGLSPVAVWFAVAASLVTVLVFGLFPAMQATRFDPGTVLKSQTGQTGGASGFRVVLATAQITFSMVLLVLAGLFTQSLANIGRVDLGMEVDTVATFSVAPVLSGYPSERSALLFQRIEEELGALPGVTSVASSMVGVMAGNNWGANLTVEGFEAGQDTDTNASYNHVGPGFFRTLQIPLLAGRDFTAHDADGAVRVAVVNQAFARKFGLGDDPLGKRMAMGAGNEIELDIEIIGIAQDAKYSGIKDEVPPQFWLARLQNPNLGFINFYVRSAIAPDELLVSIERAVSALDPDLPINNLATMPNVLRDQMFMDRLIGMLSSGFAALATLLAATGLYGVLSYSVSQRTRELGLRQALGATPTRVRHLVLRQVGWMALAGGVIGLVIAVMLGRAAEAVLFGLSGYDPVVLSVAVIVLGAVVVAAGYLPARRASRIPPMEALRYE